jgi:RNA polymerase sigma-70 factor (ECF subfamily)
MPPVHPSATQPSLLSRVRDPADQAAWRDFESKYRDLVLRYCRRRGLQATDAEDILQATLLKLMRSLPGFVYDPSRGRFRDYLYRVVRNAITDLAARQAGRPHAVDTDVLAAAAGEQTTDQQWEEEWTDHHYRQAIATVRTTFDAKSVAIFERLLAGDPAEGVAASFDMNVMAVHKVKQRVKDRLRELVEAQIAEEDRV